MRRILVPVVCILTLAVAWAEEGPLAPRPARDPIAKAEGKPAETKAEGKPAERKPAEAGQKQEAAPAAHKPGLPLVPSKEEMAHKRALKEEAERAREEAHRAARKFPTQLGDTSGPGAKQGAGTSHDRKSSTLDVTGPQHGVRR